MSARRGLAARPVARWLLALGVALFLAACGGEPPETQVEDGREAALLQALVGSEEEQVVALEEIQTSVDKRFIAPLIELVRAGQLGIAGREGYNARIIALERLSGQSYGGDWFGWAEWYGSTKHRSPPGFASWKGRLLSELEPAYASILVDDAPAKIRVEEIDWGGVPIDGIPPLEHPKHVPAAEADFLGDAEPIFGVRAGGESRAYPLRILDWHELANDTLGGVPLSLGYCTLCGSGIAYDGRVEGIDDPLDFGTSGFLYRSNKLMYDRKTRTLWHQLTGRPVFGELASKKKKIELKMLPSVISTWGEWRNRHPDTTVLSLDTGHDRPYQLGEPYGGYYASREKLFPVFESRTELKSKERVFGLSVDGDSSAWSLELLTHDKVRNDEFAGAPIVLVASGGRIEVEGYTERAGGPVSYDAGASVRVYESPSTFRQGTDLESLLDADGGTWKITEEALIGPDGQTAARLPGTLAYWFAWQAFHPETTLALLPPSDED